MDVGNPFIRLAGSPAPDAVLGYRFWTKLWPKPLTGSARLTRFEEPTAFAWRIGLKGLLVVDEEYGIAPARAGRGTELRHRVVWRGLFSRIKRRDMEAHILDGMVETDQALVKYLGGDLPKPKPRQNRGRR